jgi:hypothetical protein
MMNYLTIPVCEALPTAAADFRHQLRIKRASPTAASTLHVCRYNGSAWEWVELTLIDDPQLADIAGLTPTDNGVIIGNGTNFVVESGATLKTSLGLTIGTDVQAWDATLDTWAGKTPPAGTVVGTIDNQTLSNKTFTSTSLTDSSVAFVDNTTPTKFMRFQLSGISASTTRTLTVPDADTTIVGTDATQTLTNKTIGDALDHDGTTVGFFGTTPATQAAANADTSGATLGELETEVNELKQLLRDYGLLAT